MNDGFSWWLVVLGIAVGIGFVWLFTVRLPVSDSDIDAEERAEEAGWISETIESWGGVAPAPLVLEVLDLHKRYLDGDRSMDAPADEAPELPDDEAPELPDDEAAAADVDIPDPSPGAVQEPDAPPADALPATYAPPAFPPAGGFAEIPPPSVQRAEPE